MADVDPMTKAARKAVNEYVERCGGNWDAARKLCKLETESLDVSCSATLKQLVHSLRLAFIEMSP